MSIQLAEKVVNIVFPHANQPDLYINNVQPWSVIDSHCGILNPENGNPRIENLPMQYPETSDAVIFVSLLG